MLIVPSVFSNVYLKCHSNFGMWYPIYVMKRFGSLIEVLMAIGVMASECPTCFWDHISFLSTTRMKEVYTKSNYSKQAIDGRSEQVNNWKRKPQCQSWIHNRKDTDSNSFCLKRHLSCYSYSSPLKVLSMLIKEYFLLIVAYLAFWTLKE